MSLPQITVNTPNSGRQSATDSQAVVLSTEDKQTLDDIKAELETTATSLPHEALDPVSDLETTRDDGATVGEASLISATASQTARVHELWVTSAGAGYIELRDGAAGNVLRRVHFPAAGGWHFPFRSRPYAVTSVNTALYWYRSAAVTMTIEVDFKKS